MSFRIGDTLVYLDSNVTTQERNVLTPGKSAHTSQLVVCNPKVAACQRKCGLNPAEDTTVFGNSGYNIIPFGEAKLCDIFDSCDTLANCLSAEYGFNIGKGSALSFTKSLSEYGAYVQPVYNTISDASGNPLTFNNTSVHYYITAGLGTVSDSRYSTSYKRRVDLDFSPASCPHAFSSGLLCYTQVSNVMIVI